MVTPDGDCTCKNCRPWHEVITLGIPQSSLTYDEEVKTATTEATTAAVKKAKKSDSK